MDNKGKYQEGYSDGLRTGLIIGGVSIAFICFLLMLHYKSMMGI